MIIDVEPTHLYCDVSKNKNALYIVNPNIRNPSRLLDFHYLFSLASKKFGFDTAVSFSDFIEFTEDYATNILKVNNHSIEAKVKAFSKRFSELKTLGLINYETRLNNIYFYKNEYSGANFNPEGDTIDTVGFNFLETNSNFLLFVLSKRKCLTFITSLIDEVEKIWTSQHNRKRQGVSDIELEFIYILLPFLASKNQHSVALVAEIITQHRLTYVNLAKPKDSYRNYLKKELNLVRAYNPSFKFIKENSAKDYIDVLLRVLESTYCFKLINQFQMYSITINPNFMSKLSYYLSNDFETIKNNILNENLVLDLKSFEKKYYKDQGIHINNPTAYRYDNQDKERKNMYMTEDLIVHQNYIDDYLKNKKKILWNEFEHINNLLATYFIKKQFNQIINTNNLRYAIKMDEFGNVKNSTTGGVEDLSVCLEDITIVIESSLQNGLSARKNEVAPVLSHVDSLYRKDQKKRPILCFIVFENQPFVDIENDYISHNRINMDLDKNILYYPISSANFYKIMYVNPINLFDLIKDTKEKLSVITSDMRIKAQNYALSFKDFNIEIY